MKVCCITNDVEATTIQGDAYREDMAVKVVQEALPAVLALYKKYGVRATFFCQGSMIEKHPEIVSMIEADGHEVACHGWVHDSDKAFDVLTYEEQVEHLRKAKETIDALTTKPIVSFRAPALRVNESTARALRATDFTHDSSVAPQRLDAFMSLGSKKKLLWIGAPRGVYETSDKCLARAGKSRITEVPVSAYGLPYISTLMRMSPCLMAITRRLLYWETKRKNKKVVCFLFHPAEANPPEQNIHAVRRAKNIIVHWITGVLRMKLKKRNIGPACLPLLEKEILFWKNRGYEFKTIKEL